MASGHLFFHQSALGLNEMKLSDIPTFMDRQLQKIKLLNNITKFASKTSNISNPSGIIVEKRLRKL